MPGLFDFDVRRVCTAVGNTQLRHFEQKVNNNNNNKFIEN